MTFVDLEKLIEIDRGLKDGRGFDEESINLTKIYQGRARDLTYAWLQRMGQGDDTNTRPAQTKLLKRMVHTAAVTWANAPTRRLRLDDVELSDPKIDIEFRRDYRKINSLLKQSDRWATLCGQSIPYFSPSRRRRRPVGRVFQPHNVIRNCDPTDADNMSADEEVAFRVRIDEKDKSRSVWHYWRQIEEELWEAFVVYQNGDLVSDRDALFEDGEPPFEGAPFLQLYDEDPEGQAYVPIDETRSAFALGANVVLNEIMYLLKQEAHTGLVATGVTNIEDLPKRWGPGELTALSEPEAKLATISMNPKLIESIQVSRHVLEVFASGEGFPADYFLASRRYETGAAGKLRMQDLEARRQDQQQAALEVEEEVFTIVRGMHNAYASDWGVKRYPDEVELAIELGKPWFPVDLAELQKTYAFDLSIGAASILDYMQERDGVTREQGIEKWERIQADRVLYPLRENPAAILGGPRNANGEGSATPSRDIQRDESSMNPDRSASAEGASAIAAAKKGITV